MCDKNYQIREKFDKAAIAKIKNAVFLLYMVYDYYQYY